MRIKFTLMARLPLQQYMWKPLMCKVNRTKEMCCRSMICRFKLPELMSQPASLMRSLRPSNTFFRMEPWTRHSSNTVAEARVRTGEGDRVRPGHLGLLGRGVNNVLRTRGRQE